LGPATSAAIWSLFTISTTFLILRVYCKIGLSRGIWWDDVVLVLSWVRLPSCHPPSSQHPPNLTRLSLLPTRPPPAHVTLRQQISFLGSSILFQRVISRGFGKYPCDIAPDNLPGIKFEGGGLGPTLAVLRIAWSKTSFGITLLRLMHGRLRRFVAAVVVAMNVATVLQVVIVWVKCDPVERIWRPMVPGRCWDLRVSNGYAFFNGVLSGVCDLLFALLPWRLLWARG
jgi:hypothetical protein